MPAHFSPGALKFLRGLARNNDREWFEARRDLFECEVKQPMLAVIEDINDALADFAPEHIREPRKAMFRIYRDTRFSEDKRPYKPHVAAWWVRRGMEKTSGAGFYFHLSAKELIVAAGAYMPTPEQLLAIRRHILEHHQQLRALLANRKLKAAMQEWDADALKRPPRGFPADSPANDLICCRRWGLSTTLAPELATGPKLVSEIARRFALAAPLVAFLNAPLVGSRERETA